ncbi:MAG TPA: DUF3299 domain-containing protein [Cytophagales bacterium]|nr:DUF3299 domain-containing protein [Cytophagales bacterium]
MEVQGGPEKEGYYRRMNRKVVLKGCIPILLVLLMAAKPTPSLLDDPTGWDRLMLVRYHSAWSDEYEMEVPVPEFPLALRNLEGSEYTLSGYYLPAELDKGEMFLSMQPYSSCFFCGGAGPETVAEVHFSGRTPKLSLDEVVTVRGRLVLNRDDYAHLFFILKDASLVKE